MRATDNSSQGWFLPYLKHYFWAFLAAALLGALSIGCAGALLFTSGHLITRSALKPENILMVYVPLCLCERLVLVKPLFSIWNAW